MKLLKISIFLLFCIAASSRTTAQTLHAILVDGSSMASSKTTLLNETRLREIANTLNMTPNIVKVKSSECSVAAAISNLQCGTNDVAVLMYAGHGRNSQENDFPLFVTCQDGNTLSLAHSDVVKGLRRSGCRLVIVGYDACNHGARAVDNGEHIAAPSYKKIWKKLFLESRGVVRMCSSAPNKYSYEVANFGGLFTNSFYESLKDSRILAATTPEQAWQLVGTITKEKTNEKNTQINVPKQDPILRYEPITTRSGGHNNGDETNTNEDRVVEDMQRVEDRRNQEIINQNRNRNTPEKRKVTGQIRFE